MHLVAHLKDAFTGMHATWVMWLLLALLLASIGVAVERWLFFRSLQDDLTALAGRLDRLLRQEHYADAVRLLQASPSAEAAVVLAGLAQADRGPAAIERGLAGALALQRLRLERGLAFLGTLGNNAPFLGLFGTVIGIIQAFHMLGSSGAGGNQAAMGNVIVAISEALIATGVGLVVALPAVVGYNITQKKVGNVENNVQQIGKQLLALLKADDKLIREFRALSEEPPVSEAEAQAALEERFAVAEQAEAS